jgi:rhodanese-related sulfurtransferase
LETQEILMQRTITREELSSVITAGKAPLLLEALPARYFDDWHLPGARNMPHDAVAELAPRLAPDKSAPIVVYCASASCQNSHIAAGVLKQLGYADVRVYPGGKKDWTEAGLPIEQGSAVAA